MIPTHFPDIQGARLRLRPFREADLPAFVAYRNNPDVARYQSWHDYDMDRARAFWEQQRDLQLGLPDSWYQVAIADGEDRLVGDLALHFLEDGRQLELGFTLDPACQGRGYGQEAATLLLELAFGDWQMHRVMAITDARNAPAAALLARLGFRREGHFIQNIWFKGAWGDEYLYAQLAGEWASRTV
ncbi:GNAT family protein [Gallaecimonas sp. GXIMD4217]|uniref:GNAT family N-acetyltransferase n=1 Tax=Gallaecimonas sp. GXIMD4217 TaxID=3131927 RepID=UPI00311AEBDD